MSNYCFLPVHEYLSRSEFLQVAFAIKTTNPHARIYQIFVEYTDSNSFFPQFSSCCGSTSPFSRILKVCRSPVGNSRLRALIILLTDAFLFFYVLSLRSVVVLNSQYGSLLHRLLILFNKYFKYPKIFVLLVNDFSHTPRTSRSFLLRFAFRLPIIRTLSSSNLSSFRNLRFFATSHNQFDSLVSLGVNKDSIYRIDPFPFDSSKLALSEIPSITLCLECLSEVYPIDSLISYYKKVLCFIRLFDIPLYIRPHPREDPSFTNQIISLCSSMSLDTSIVPASSPFCLTHYIFLGIAVYL